MSEHSLPEQPWEDGAPEPHRGSSQAQSSHDWENTLQNAADDWGHRVATHQQQARQPSRSRSAERRGERQSVKEQVERWQQLSSANAARQREGLPKQLRMPEAIAKREIPDSWELDADRCVIIRHHHEWRSKLFVPTSVPTCPVPLDQLTGKRTTIWVSPGGDQGSFVDDFKASRDPDRKHRSRWKGSTILEIKIGVDVLAPKRKELMEPPEPSAGSKRRGTSRGSRTTANPATTTTEPPQMATTGSGSSGTQQARETPAQETMMLDSSPATPATTTEPAQMATTGAFVVEKPETKEHEGPEVYNLVDEDAAREIDEQTYLLVKKRVDPPARARHRREHVPEPTSPGTASRADGGETALEGGQEGMRQQRGGHGPRV